MFFCLFVFEIIISCGAGIRLKHKKYLGTYITIRNSEIEKLIKRKKKKTCTQPLKIAIKNVLDF